MYVWLNSPDEAGTFALVSIGVCALATGYTSAMISFDMDVDLTRRTVQPSFYGYVPEHHSLRGRCFALMTMISALHNASRSIGVALLLSSALGKRLAIYVISGEMLIYLIWKAARRNFFCFYRIEMKAFAVLMSFLQVSVLKRPVHRARSARCHD